jgi:hypothetical protein
MRLVFRYNVFIISFIEIAEKSAQIFTVTSQTLQFSLRSDYTKCLWGFR